MKKRYPDKTNILLVNITRLGDMLQATPTIAGHTSARENFICMVDLVGICVVDFIGHILMSSPNETVRTFG